MARELIWNYFRLINQAERSKFTNCPKFQDLYNIIIKNCQKEESITNIISWLSLSTCDLKPLLNNLIIQAQNSDNKHCPYYHLLYSFHYLNKDLAKIAQPVLENLLSKVITTHSTNLDERIYRDEAKKSFIMLTEEENIDIHSLSEAISKLNDSSLSYKLLMTKKIKNVEAFKKQYEIVNKNTNKFCDSQEQLDDCLNDLKNIRKKLENKDVNYNDVAKLKSEDINFII